MADSRKICAYCDGPGPFTREHIWPSGFLARGDYGVRFSSRAQRTFTGDLVIADVCALCNNGPLSRLDAHACELYDRRFAKFAEPGRSEPFTYDYGLLLRWLLKTSYNSARLSGQDRDLLAEYRRTIIAPDPCTPVFVAAFVATIAPSTMMNKGTGERKRLYPLATRSGRSHFTDVSSDDLAVLRSLTINSYFFTLLIMKPTAAPTADLHRRMSRIPGEPLDPSGSMRIGPPTIPAHTALGGVENWPALQAKK